MIEVLGIPFYTKDVETIVEQVVTTCNSNQIPYNYCISASGAHGLVEASKDEAFKNILTNYHLNLPDGMPTVWVGRLKGASGMQRCYGPDFFMKVMQDSAKTKIKHFLCGGKEGIADKLQLSCLTRFGNSNIVGTFCPPFREMTHTEIENLAQQIEASKADIVWIGMSCPKQEKFAYRLAKYTNVHYLVAVGAAFDFHSGQVRQAPKWMQKIGLEWFFRLLMEPKRLFSRYFEIVPKFIWLNIKEFILYVYRKNLQRDAT